MFCLVNTCCICLTNENQSHYTSWNTKDNDDVTYEQKLKLSFSDVNCSEKTADLMLCEQCCYTINIVYEFHKKCLFGISLYLANRAKLHPSNNKPSKLNVNLANISDILSNMPRKQKESNIVELHIKTEVDNDSYDNNNKTWAEGMPEQEVIEDNIKIEEVDMNSTCFPYDAYENFYLTYRDECLEASVKTSSNVIVNSINQEHEVISNLNQECQGTKTQGIKNIENEKNAGNKRFECDICYRKFAHKSNMKVHKLLHSGEKPFECDFCHRKFTQNSNLQIHKRVHTGERPFVCGLCSKGFIEKRALKIHRCIYNGGKPYVCRVCDDRFTTESLLAKHKKLHVSSRPYVCGECKRGFTQHIHLVQHKRTHTGERPYSCHICKKSFVLSGNLKGHLRIHTGEKPYKCRICNTAFRHNNNLKRHMQSHYSTSTRHRLATRR